MPISVFMKKPHQASRLSTPVGYLRSKVGGFVSRVILEIDDNQDILKGYLWGMDLSGTGQGAGGVGGLLAMVDVQETIAAVAFYDANGNLTQLYDWINEEVIAHYEYDPFGNIINQTGTYAEANTFRFSTKYLDGETGLYYYGFRYYDPETGRWPSRDPIEEQGGLNLYGFVNNNPVVSWDLLGLLKIPALLRWIVENGIPGPDAWESPREWDDMSLYTWRTIETIWTNPDVTEVRSPGRECNKSDYSWTVRRTIFISFDNPPTVVSQSGNRRQVDVYANVETIEFRCVTSCDLSTGEWSYEIRESSVSSAPNRVRYRREIQELQLWF